MKYKKFILASLLCSFFVLAAVVSCKKDTECTAIIFTYTMQNGVKTPVGACPVVIGEIRDAQRELDTNIRREVITDAGGYYEGTWLRQAHLPVEVKKPISNSQYYYGIAFLTLDPGNITQLDIPLEVYNY